jgi:hypothetical protein
MLVKYYNELVKLYGTWHYVVVRHCLEVLDDGKEP